MPGCAEELALDRRRGLDPAPRSFASVLIGTAARPGYGYHLAAWTGRKVARSKWCGAKRKGKSDENEDIVTRGRVLARAIYGGVHSRAGSTRASRSAGRSGARRRSAPHGRREARRGSKTSGRSENYGRSSARQSRYRLPERRACR